jgi:hypothetical protein
MQYSQVPAILRAMISKYLRVDEWGINNPQNIEAQGRPPSIGLIIPVRLESEAPKIVGGEYTVQTSPVHEFQVIYRFPSLNQYEQLPHDDMAALMLSLKSTLELEIRCEFQESAQSAPTVTAEYSIYRAENKDWLVLFKIKIQPRLLFDKAELLFKSTYFSPQP